MDGTIFINVNEGEDYGEISVFGLDLQHFEVRRERYDFDVHILKK